MRIVSWNIDNLAPYLSPDADVTLVDVAARLGDPDVLCLQEIRVRPIDGDLVARMRSAMPGYECHYSLNRDAVNASYRGGRAYGVATFTRAQAKARTLLFPWDREGRIVVVGIDNVAIANVYAVNGTAKPYFDPDTREPLDDRHHFKRRFIAALQSELQALRRAGVRLILVGDWNVSRSQLDVTPRLRAEAPHAAAREQINDAFIPQLNLVDIFRERFPDARAYTWISRRSRGGLDAARVDYALVEAELAPKITATGISATPPHRGSDHVPLWLDFDDAF